LDTDLIEKESLRDQKTQLALLRQYIKDEGFDEEEWKVVEKLVERNLAHANEEENPRHAKWSIKRMEWENTFTYGKDNVIDFTKLNGVVGLFGPNRSGKSSIPGSIMYGLYNTTDRGSIKNLHIVNARKGHCNVTIDFTLNGKTYRVERMTTKSTNKRGITGAATHMNLWQLDSEGNQLVDMSGEQRRDSDKILRGLIGTSEDFLLTSFASQGEMNNFIKEKASARKMYLSSFLDLGVFDEMFRRLKEESYGLKGTMKSPRIDYEKTIGDSRSDLQSLESKKEALKTEIEESREKVHDLNLVLATHKDRGTVTQADVDEAERVLTASKSKREENLSKVTELRDTREKSELKLEKITALKSKFPLQALRDELNELRDLEKRESGFDSTLEKEKMVLKNQEKSASRLAEVPCGDSFPSCKFIKDSHRDKKLIEQQKKVIADLQDQMKEVSRQVTVIREKALEEKLRRYDEVLREEATLTVKVKSYMNEEKLLEESILALGSKITQSENDIASMRLRVVDAESSNEIDSLKRKIYELQDVVKAKETDLSTTDRNCGLLLGRIESLVAEQESYLKARKEWRIYEKLLAAYGKNGIPLMILATELPKINAEISKILHGVTGFTVILEADPESNDLEVYLDYGDSQRPIELGSGMEKMMASLAIRVALINISSLPKTDILVIDEGFGALDDANVEACNRLLSALKRYFKAILVISHVDGVKEAVDGMIEIGKEGKDSHVCYV
jgi:DNA repair exonuclease SbcCD ATPase subunit